MIIVDGHEDIAWNVLTFGRDYTRPVEEIRRLEAGTDIPARAGNALLGWPEWQQGDIAVVFATLFATPLRHRRHSWDHLVYADADQARQVYRQSLDVYRRLTEDHPDRFCLLRSCADLDAHLAAWQAPGPEGRRLGMVLLMEGADAIRTPDELIDWHAAGLRLLGPAWAATRHAGGTREPGPITSAGWDLLQVMAQIGMPLDLSHLSDEGCLDVLERYPGPVFASHSNPRRLLPHAAHPERQLSDLTIRRLAERQGVIGVVIYNRFLIDGWTPAAGRTTATLDHVVACIDTICQLAGSSRHVAIGSDFDGAFGLEMIPAGLDSIADLRLIGEALARHGYLPDDIAAILAGNWIDFLRRTLPET
jgi:membrane dipeptidase